MYPFSGLSSPSHRSSVSSHPSPFPSVGRSGYRGLLAHSSSEDVSTVRTRGPYFIRYLFGKVRYEKFGAVPVNLRKGKYNKRHVSHVSFSLRSNICSIRSTSVFCINLPFHLTIVLTSIYTDTLRVGKLEGPGTDSSGTSPPVTLPVVQSPSSCLLQYVDRNVGSDATLL